MATNETMIADPDEQHAIELLATDFPGDASWDHYYVVKAVAAGMRAERKACLQILAAASSAVCAAELSIGDRGGK